MMINPLLLIESLQKTYVFRPRSYFWLARQHNNLEQFSSKLEEMKNIPIDKAEKYIRNAVSLEAAELLTRIIPGAEMVKFAKNGSNATTAAAKIARAYTGRKWRNANDHRSCRDKR